MNAKSRLGRGLSALIQGAEQTARLGDKDVLEIDLERIDFNPDQPRRLFDEEKLRGLANSIGDVGILQPILVRRLAAAVAAEAGGGVVTTPTRYAVVAGERRVRAARLAGLARVPALVCTYEETEALKIALLENIQREDLGAVEEASAFQNLIDAYGATQEELAAMLGKSRSGVANALRLLTLEEEIQAMLGAGEITRGHAKVLAGVENRAFRASLARMCRNRGLSVRECERRAKHGPGTRRRRTSRSRAKLGTAAEIPEIRALRERCETVMGAPVRIDYDAGKGRGTVKIAFFSDEDLERVLEKLGVDTDLS